MIVFQGCRSASRRDDRQWAEDNGLEGARSMLAGGLFGLSRSSGNLSVACLPVRLPGIRKRGSSTVSQRIARRGERGGRLWAKGLAGIELRQGEERRQMNWDPTSARRGSRANIFQAVNLELRAEPGRTVGKTACSREHKSVLVRTSLLWSVVREALRPWHGCCPSSPSIAGQNGRPQELGSGIIHERAAIVSKIICDAHQNVKNQSQKVERKSCTREATRAPLYLSLSSQYLSSVLRCNLGGCDRGRLTTQAEVASNY